MFSPSRGTTIFPSASPSLESRRYCRASNAISRLSRAERGGMTCFFAVFVGGARLTGGGNVVIRNRLTLSS